MNLNEILIFFIKYLILLAEASGSVVIGVGIITALIRYLITLIKNMPAYQEEIRIGFGRALVLGLEFELASDILKTSVSPTIKTIGVLAAIVVLRTALNYFLQRELHLAKKENIV